MKNRLFAIALMAVMVVGFSACPSSGEKDKDNIITKFEVEGVSYEVKSNGEIYKLYPKTAPTGGASEGTWDIPIGKKTPVITYPKKATISGSIELDFSKCVSGETVTLATFDVIAENGDKKPYTVKVLKGSL